VHFTLSEKALSKVIYTPEVYLLKINVNGKTYDAVMREIQFHPVTDKTLHIDFYQIFEDKPVVVEVPVKVSGFAAGVQAGGKLVLISRKLKVKALPKDMPDYITIDVTNLGLGKSIQVKELAFDNFEVVNAKDVVIVQVKMTRAARAAEAAR
ncbi:MAG: 50S ribosomal protein L25, partial [Odoribacter sp.]|nr:50S ribosomal protein L25 [Odoribacter sp.]